MKQVHNVDLSQCKLCKFAEDTAVFQLCKHESSEYKDNMGKMQFHTRSHILSRTVGQCMQYVRK